MSTHLKIGKSLVRILKGEDEKNIDDKPRFWSNPFFRFDLSAVKINSGTRTRSPAVFVGKEGFQVEGSVPGGRWALHSPDLFSLDDSRQKRVQIFASELLVPRSCHP